METLNQHEVTAVGQTSIKWTHGLKSLDNAALEIGVTAERLRDLANSGFAPHYRIDGGPPLFRISDLKQWTAENLLEYARGRNLPAPVRIIIDQPAAELWKVPRSLRLVKGLCDITGDLYRTGIYFLCRDGCVLYVGQSINISMRIADHARRYEFDSAYYLPCPIHELNDLEAALIRSLRPTLNGQSPRGTMVTSKGDKNGDDKILATILEAVEQAEEQP